MPYDLKNTHKEGITKAKIIKDRKGFAKDMYEGADKQGK